jgi:mutator protein MutT
MTTSWIQVAAAIIERDGYFLLAQRFPDTHLGGLWEFPGGKCQSNETLEDCVKREVFEELGVEVSDPQFFDSIRHPYPDKNIELHFYSCSIVGGELQALGCAQYSWVRPEEFSGYEFPPADIPIVQKLREKVSTGSFLPQS